MSTPTITDTDATVQTDDGPMPVHVAIPAGRVKGAVVVVHEAFGVTGYIEDITRRFAAQGWYAVAPALFHRAGSPVIDYAQITKARPVMDTLNPGALTTDLVALFANLRESGYPDARTCVVGFCMGGTVSLYAATLRPLAAAVTFYGGGILEGRFGLPALVDLAPSLSAPWLGLYGDKDQSIPPDQVEQLRAAVAGAPVETEIVRYPDAGHGFHCDARPGHFSPEAAQDAWRRALGWMERLSAAHAPATPEAR